MKTQIPAAIVAGASSGLTVAYAMTGMKSIVMITAAWIAIVIASALWIDHLAYLERRKIRQDGRNEVLMLRDAEDFEILCDIEAGRKRRQIFEAVEKINV